jgi:hypothetical protein
MVFVTSVLLITTLPESGERVRSPLFATISPSELIPISPLKYVQPP